MDKSVKRDLKKPYSPPHLIVHGTVRDLTQALITGPAKDSGRFPHTHATRVG
jgi:hypothetical protein